MTDTTTKPKVIKEKYQLLINGEYTDGSQGAFFDTYNPATEETLSKVAKASKEDVDKAVEVQEKRLNQVNGLDRQQQSEQGC